LVLDAGTILAEDPLSARLLQARPDGPFGPADDLLSTIQGTWLKGHKLSLPVVDKVALDDKCRGRGMWDGWIGKRMRNYCSGWVTSSSFSNYLNVVIETDVQ